MGKWETAVSVFVVLFGALCVCKPSTESDFRAYLVQQAKTDPDYLSRAFSDPLRALKSKFWPLEYYPLGPVSFGKFDGHYYFGAAGYFLRSNSPFSKSFWTFPATDKETLDVGFLAINVIVFVSWSLFGATFMRKHFICSMENTRAFRLWSLCLSNVSHSEVMHLLMNMVSFHSMIDFFFRSKSLRRLVMGLMIGSGLSGSFASLTYFGIIKGFRHELHGASAITSGMQTFIALRFPTASFLFYGLTVTARQMLAITLGIELVRGNSRTGGGSGVDFAAHIGGILFGYFYYHYIYR